MTHPFRRRAPAAGAGTTARVLAGLLALGLLGACAAPSSGAESLPRTTPSSGPPVETPPPTPAAVALVTAARPFTVHAPPGHDPATPAPLLILLHGFGVTGELEERYLRLTEATDAHGMLFVAPDGTASPRGARFWNATDACCGAASGVDDVGYLRAVIAEVKTRYAVDPRRVFLVGHSNGGFMSYRMACDDAGEIAAIVSIAGATFADAARCRPSAPVAVLEVHGTSDHTIAYRGGRVTTRSPDYPSAARTVSTWARYDGCRLDAPVEERARRRIVSRLAPPTVRSYGRCRDDAAVELWTQPHAPHIPEFAPAFRDEVVAFLLAHPKP